MKISDEKGIFKKYAIEGADEIEYENFNLIIGENGSGKTRFLKALKEYYIEELKIPSARLVYAYFPAINHLGNNITDEGEDIPIYDFLYLNDDTNFDFYFEDFIKFIEHGGYGFFEELLTHSKAKSSFRRQRSENTQSLLNELLISFMQKEINFEEDNISVKDYRYSNSTLSEELGGRMSPGELVLFYISIFIFILQKNKNKELIIIFDEPELHLHPKVLLKFVNILLEKNCCKQVWIATHSLFLLPNFKFDNIVYLDKGVVIKRNSSLYEKIYDSMVGFNNKSLYRFLSSLDNWKYWNFIAECFCLPTVVAKTSQNDEQFLMFLKHIENIKNDRSIKILDYGGGEGRIWKCIELLKSSVNPKTDNMLIDYSIYDEFCTKPDDVNCEYWNNINDIYKKGCLFDCIILMNTLHEINITEWVRVFKRMDSILSNNGNIFLLEVISLIHGEQPYGDSGYIILDKPQILTLFNCKDNEINVITIKEKDKSKCFIIPKKILKNITDKTLDLALDSLYNDTFNRLKKINSKRIEAAHNKEIVDDIDIREYAFLSQMHFNILFAKDLLTSNNKLSSNSLTLGSKTNSGYDKYFINDQTIIDRSRKFLGKKNKVITRDIVEDNWREALKLESIGGSIEAIINLLSENASVNHQKSINKLRNNYFRFLS